MSLRPAASPFDHSVCRVTASTTITACCLTRGCIPYLTTSSIRIGTWDLRRAVRSSRNKLVSKPLRRPRKRTRERIVASSKKTEYHHRVRSTHGDCCEEDRSTGRRLKLIEDGKPQGVAIVASLVGLKMIGVCAKKCKFQIWKKWKCVKTVNVGDWKKPVQ